MELKYTPVPLQLSMLCRARLAGQLSELLGGTTVRVDVGEVVQGGATGIKVELRSGDPARFGSDWQTHPVNMVPLPVHAVVNALRDLCFWGRYLINASVTRFDSVEVTRY